MPGEEESYATCGKCGATVYPEHLARRVAEHWEGVLLCPFCLREQRSASGAAMPAVTGEPGSEPVALVELEPAGAGGLADEPIAYDKKPTAIRAIGGGPGGLPVGKLEEYVCRRPLLKGSPNATRCKTFHCKLADGALAYMCREINEWVDSDDNIEIKFATSTIGVVEGKHVDPHLILTIFY